MPRRTNAFQRLITLLNATLADSCKVEESALLRDKISGEEREVDIVITPKAAPYIINIGIEVISWKRPAGSPWVEQMRAKHENLALDKLILVSESGFTAPALMKAAFHGIDTLTVERALETDWPLATSLTGTGTFELTTLQYDCAAVCVFAGGKRKQLEIPLNTNIAGDGVTTVGAVLAAIVDSVEFRNALYPHVKGEGNQEFWFSYQPPGLWRVLQDGIEGEVQELRVGLHVLNRQTPIQFASGKYLDSPFVAGMSSGSIPPLQFVLAKRSDGTVAGRLVNTDGVRSLILPTQLD